MRFRIPLDDHGQPLNRAFNQALRNDRSTTELIGLLKGITADGRVTPEEVEFLARWVLANEEAVYQWPVDAIVARLNRIFADERITEDECEDLRVLVDELVGNPALKALGNASTRLPLCKPAPDVIFDQNAFVLTGRFVYGTRKTCEREILERGGTCSDRVTLQTSYLVIGEIGSADWVQTTHGRKIELAVKYKTSCPIAIISEEHWSRFLLPDRASNERAAGQHG